MAQKTVNLALQGGGAHGAFTWGVLDALLEDGRLTIDGVSGASAGAMNAVAMAEGWARDGRDGARETLDKLWTAVSRAGLGSPIQRSPIDMILGGWSLDHSPGFAIFDLLSRVASPYQLNPMNLNPLRDIVADLIDFEKVRSCDSLRLFISATDVETGKTKVFKTPEITPDHVMASACLPFIFQAVEIEGRHYWDGGYMGNPVLFPFHYGCSARDLILVQINPLERKGVPTTARDILNRVNEITFNSALLKELRAIDFVHRLIDQGALSAETYADVRMHVIENHEALNPMEASSKLNTEWAFIKHLKEIGQDTAKAWLDKNYDKVGVEASLNIRELFDGPACDTNSQNTAPETKAAE